MSNRFALILVALVAVFGTIFFINKNKADTPTFFIDGKKIEQNPQDQAAFEKLIENAIANKTQ